jgi:two-component system, LytTR family, response regulator
MKAIIVEDNPNSVQVIRTILAEYEPDIKVCATAETVTEAAELIRRYRPNLWLLDIRLKDELVFSLFGQVDRQLVNRSAIVFITAYNSSDYLQQAIESSALAFIYKPIDEGDLLKAVQRSRERIGDLDISRHIKEVEEQVSRLYNQHNIHKIPIFKSCSMIQYPEADKVMYIEADSSISRFFLIDGTMVISIKNLGFYKNGLTAQGSFMQISKKHIVNLRHVQSYDGGRDVLMLDDGTKLDVSRRSGKRLKEYFRNLFQA